MYLVVGNIQPSSNQQNIANGARHPAMGADTFWECYIQRTSSLARMGMYATIASAMRGAPPWHCWTASPTALMNGGSTNDQHSRAKQELGW